MDFVEFENERLLQYGKYKKFLLIGILTFVIIIGLIFIAIAVSKKKKYEKQMKQKMVDYLLNDLYPGSVFSPNGGIKIGVINGAGLIKAPDRYSSEDLITGEYKNVKFTLADCCLEERHERVDSNGHREVYYEVYFKGRWFVFDFERDFGQIIRIKEKQVFDDGLVKRGLTKCEVESIDFTDKFHLYASDQQKLFYLLTPPMIQAMLNLESMFKGKIMFAFIGGELHVGINSKKDYLELKIKEPINDATLNKYRAQIDIIGAIINEFGLDSYKFKNEAIA